MNFTQACTNFFMENVVSKPYIATLELMLLILTAWYLLKKKESKKKKKYTYEEEEEIIAKWVPEPLITPSDDAPEFEERLVQSKLAGIEFSNSLTRLDGALVYCIGKFVVINGSECLNLASLSFLGLSDRPDIAESAARAVRKYGVGSCGPRGFYGTVDVHLELEERLAKFMGVEEAVVYSYGFSTISSAIPAYSKRGDIIFADEEVNFAIQKGFDASRSEIKFFKHNDMNDLENILSAQEDLDKKNKRKAAKTRKFLIVEGIYMKTGKICPLPELIALRKKYKLRLFIDESVSFGTIGQSGRGVTEYFNIPMIEVDLIMATMECALASVGGFCLGSSFIVEHQRLSGLGYCFSASLPPLLTSAAMSALVIIENNPQIVCELQNICSEFHHALLASSLINHHFNISGDKISPIKHLQTEDKKFIKLFVKKCEEKHIAVTPAAYLATEVKAVIPSIRLSINRLLTKSEIQNSIKIFEEVLAEIHS